VGFRWVAAALARRSLNRAVGAGLPPQIAAAVGVLFASRLDAGCLAAAKQVEKLRAALEARGVETHALSSDDTAGTQEVVTSAHHLAHVASVSRASGLLLHMLARQLPARVMIELGAGAGVSGAYLATGCPGARLLTVEGSPDRASLARETLAAVSESATVLQTSFAEGLELALTQLDGSVDLVHIDGERRPRHLQALVEMVAPRLRVGGVLVVDDVRWSPEMWQGWRAVAALSWVDWARAPAGPRGGRGAARLRTACAGLIPAGGTIHAV
jgi:predicted O-methyltransferase YrrM